MSRYDLFLSYNSKDSSIISEIAVGLKQMRIQSFLDRKDLTKGQAWMPELAQALADTRSVAVFIGRHGLGEFQYQEVQLALQRQSSARGAGTLIPVFAVLLPGAKRTDIPDWLTLNTWLDLTSGTRRPENLAELERAVRGTAIDRPLPDHLDSGISWRLWASMVAALVAAVTLLVFFLRTPEPFIGAVTVKWWDSASWEGAHWNAAERNTLLVAGAAPGLLKMPDSRLLRDFEVRFNIAVRSSEDVATWIIRAANANRYVRFRDHLPRNGHRGVLEGWLVPGSTQPFCSQPIYTEPFGDGHALIVIVQVFGGTVLHRLNLTCPQDDQRCSGSHDPVENGFRDIRCTLPAGAPSSGRFGFMGDGPAGVMEIEEFSLEGLAKGEPK